ncbi:MAG: glycoside hydrolase family 9 protein [Pseudomonadota bacterium]
MIVEQDEFVAVLSKIMLCLAAVLLNTLVARAELLTFADAKLSDDWNKKALVGSLLADGIRIKTEGEASFNDASSWTITFDEPLAVNRDEALTFTVATGKAHSPLWQNLLFALRVNGQPIETVATGSVDKKDLLLGDDGERYVPFNESKGFDVAVNVPDNALKTFTIITAGAEGLDVTLRDLSVQKRKAAPRIVANTPKVKLSDAQIALAAKEAWRAFAAFCAEPDHCGLHNDPARRAVVLGDQSKVLDVSGGWFDAGDYGRYTVNTAHSATVILLTSILAPDAVSERALQRSGLRKALDWLLKMQRADGGAYHKVASARFAAMTTKPQEDRAQRFVAPVTSTATAQLATALHLGAVVYGDPVYAEAADKAQAWLARNPDLKMIPARFGQHAFGGHYGDGEDKDERFMARAARQFRIGKTILTDKDFAKAKRRFLMARDDAGWKNSDLFALWLAAASGDKRADGLLRDAAAHWQAARTSSPFDIPHRTGDPVLWGFNGRMALRAWHMAAAGQAFGRADWAQTAGASLGWFFGANPRGQIMVTGQSTGRIKNPHFRPHTSGAVALPEGLLVGGPNQETDMKSRPPLARHVDSAKSYRTNEVAINWQAAFASALSLVAHQAQHRTTGSVPLP